MPYIIKCILYYLCAIGLSIRLCGRNVIYQSAEANSIIYRKLRRILFRGKRSARIMPFIFAHMCNYFIERLFFIVFSYKMQVDFPYLI